jgi:hypothetical protein
MLACENMVKKKSKLKLYVNHPRYGAHPIPSEDKISEEELKWAHWRYQSLKCFPETAIRADIDKQNYAIYPRRVYVDIEETCGNCGRPFIFFAKEQKYWFEILGFWVDAHCTKCIDCRKKVQEIKLLQKRYQVLVGKENRSPSESKDLKAVAMELYQLGFIRDTKKIEI